MDSKNPNVRAAAIAAAAATEDYNKIEAANKAKADAAKPKQRNQAAKAAEMEANRVRAAEAKNEAVQQRLQALNIIRAMKALARVEAAEEAARKKADEEAAALQAKRDAGNYREVAGHAAAAEAAGASNKATTDWQKAGMLRPSPKKKPT